MLSSFSTTRVQTFQPGYNFLDAFYIFHVDYTTAESSKVTQDVKEHYILLYLTPERRNGFEEFSTLHRTLDFADMLERRITEISGIYVYRRVMWREECT